MTLAREFAMLLTEAVYRIRSLESKDGKSIQIVQDELGYAIGRESGGSAIEHWRKGNVPAQHRELEVLAAELMRRADLGRGWLLRFLTCGRHPAPQQAAEALLLALAAGGVAQPAAGRPEQAGPSLVAAPFIAGPPVTHPRHFFGRGPTVRRIFHLLHRLPLQNAAVIGMRRSGKSSLLHYLRAITMTPTAQLRPGQRGDWLPDPASYCWVMVDFQDARLGRREGLLRHLLSSLGLPLPDECTLERFLDAVIAGVRAPTVVLLDEIGSALQRYPELDDELWESLRALGPQVGGRLGFVLASHISPMQLAHDTGHSSPFFNIFGYTAHLSPLSEQEALELIGSSPTPFEPDDVAWILEHGRGWPIILQTLCHERLASLEDGVADARWRDEALRQIEQYQALQ
jgi:hypothetical protein